MSKLTKMFSLKTAVQRLTALIGSVAQAASEDIAALDEKKVNQSDYDAAMAQLYIDIFSGEIPTTLCNQDGEEITTSDGAVLQAVRKIRKGSD